MSRFSPRMGHTSSILGNQLIVVGGTRLDINAFDDTNKAVLETGCPNRCFNAGECVEVRSFLIAHHSSIIRENVIAKKVSMEMIVGTLNSLKELPGNAMITAG